MAGKKTSTPKAKKDYQITKKRSGRYSVMRKNKMVNGLEKAEILVKEGLVKTGLPKK